VTLLLHLRASIRLPAFHLASCCALVRGLVTDTMAARSLHKRPTLPRW